MASNTLGFMEGQAINRPPILTGTNYAYWKCRMRIFLRAQNISLWSVIENGPIVIEGKNESNYTKAEKEKVQLNEIAMNILYCGLCESDFSRICTCNSAKEIWDNLENTYEGSTRMKDTKISLLCGEFENFKMKANESIDEMNDRFIKIINQLCILGKTYTNLELNSKILRSLPREWEAKRTAIEEAHDLSLMSKEELLGTLKTHEMIKNHREEETKKEIVLKASCTSSSEEEDESEEEDDEELDELTKKFTMFLKVNKRMKKDDLNSKSRRKTITCYKCNQPGHIQQFCPNDRKSSKGGRKKAYMATWSDGESSTSDENMCLMALDDEVCSNSSQVPYDEIVEMYDKACKELIKMKKKNEMLKSLMKNVGDEMDTFKDEHEQLKSENEKLHEEIDFLKLGNDKLANKIKKLKGKNDELSKLNEKLHIENDLLDLEVKTLSGDDKSEENIECVNCSNGDILNELNNLKIENEKLKTSLNDANSTIAKFTKGENNLSTLLGKQRMDFNKFGIGYDRNNACKNHKTRFVRATYGTCNYCGKLGHIAHKCAIRKAMLLGHASKFVWVPRREILVLANQKGPKQKWVPKR